MNSDKRNLVVAVIVAAVCCASAAEKVNVGMYADYGTRGGGVMGWAKILSNSPQIDLTLIDADEIRAGKLKDHDVLLMPGGLTGDEFKKLMDKPAFDM